jgi:hypothetical protein
LSDFFATSLLLLVLIFARLCPIVCLIFLPVLCFLILVFVLYPYRRAGRKKWAAHAAFHFFLPDYALFEKKEKGREGKGKETREQENKGTRATN